MKTPTNEYAHYQSAFEYYNAELFDGILPPCLITLQRTPNALGYFSPYRFAARKNQTLRTDEIALNPDTFAGASDKSILSTLVHEMCHLWQAHFGKPGRGRYHNRQWASAMQRLGLKPISFDNPGKMTGQRVSHEIIEGGRFELATDRLLAGGFRLEWQSALPPMLGEPLPFPMATARKPSKVKYTCPDCKQNAWAKPLTRLVCGYCDLRMIRPGWE